MRKRIILPITGFVLLLVFMTNCVQYRESTLEMSERFPDARFDTVISRDRTLRYMNIHREDTFPTLFFLHGSPSSMSVYNMYYEDQELASWTNIIAADRPGYGFSGMGRSETSVEKQAEKMWKILEKEGLPRPLYLLGSSYGGTVAAKMAMMHPERVDGILLVSASLAPGLEHTYKISYLIQFPPLRWILPASIRSANDEKLSHRASLEKMVPLWELITAPVIFIYGTADELIFPENADFARKRLINSDEVQSIALEGEGHFLQQKYKDMILENLENLVRQNGHFPLMDMEIASEQLPEHDPVMEN